MIAQPLDRLDDCLRAIAPRMDPAHLDAWTRMWVAALSPPMWSSGIVTPRRIAMFLGQVAYESESFTQLEENLNYSANRLLAVFPSHFSGPEDAQAFDHKPIKIANRVYANRMGNGDEASGDGWLFHGRGLIQLTGRENYRALALVEKVAPEILTTVLTSPGMAATSACWFWNARALNDPAEGWNVWRVTQAINGGQNGAAGRTAVCNSILSVFRKSA